MTYSGPVIDTHHHIWLRKDVGWLADPPVPRMFGDYFGIRRDYPVEEFIEDVKNLQSGPERLRQREPILKSQFRAV